VPAHGESGRGHIERAGQDEEEALKVRRIQQRVSYNYCASGKTYFESEA
jgi:hypothetical protein